MEHFIAALAGLKSAWISISFLIGIIIWIYRLRLDTNVNTKAIVTLKEDLEKRDIKIDEAIEKNVNRLNIIDNEIDVKLEKIEFQLHNEIRTIKVEIKDELKSYAEREVQRAIRMFEKLELMQKDLTDIKIDQARVSVMSQRKD